MAFSLVVLGLLMLVSARGSGWWAWPLIWSAVCLLGLGVAYMLNQPGLFGKRPDGTRARWSRWLTAPYTLLAALVWHIWRRLQREPPVDEVHATLKIGRRLLPHERPAGLVWVLDLTAEFAEPAATWPGVAYYCLPVLDGGVPDPHKLQRLLNELVGYRGSGFIHCAMGHGRTSLVAAALLHRQGYAATSEAACTLIAAKRKGARPNRRQAAFLRRFTSGSF